MKEIEDVISTLEEHLNEANNDIKLASQGYNVASEEYLQGRIDTLAQAIRIVKSIKSEPQTIIEFTFDDVLAIQCYMEIVKKVQEDEALYNKLLELHSKLYDACH